MPIIIPALILVFLFIVLAFVLALNAETNEKNSVFGGLEMILFLVMMPKNPTKKEGENQKEEKMMIAQMEQVFANFLYLKKVKMYCQKEVICTLFRKTAFEIIVFRKNLNLRVNLQKNKCQM